MVSFKRLGAESQLGHAFLLSGSSLEQLQTALVEQIIPQLAQAAGGQVAVLQYVFQDEQQPIAAQFIQDSQTLLANGSDNQMYSRQGSFLSQSMGASGYRINADLMAQAGEFSKTIVYQRLY